MSGKLLRAIVALSLLGALLVGCGAGGDGGAVEETPAEGGAGGADFPPKDPAEPFAMDEKGTVTLTNDQAYTVQVQRADGTPFCSLSFKRNGVIDPEVDFAVQTIPFVLPEDMAGSYVPVGERAFELHVVGEQTYGFALRPELKVYFTEDEIAAAKAAGAALDTLAGNLLVLYNEQLSPKWTPQTSVAVNEADRVVTVSNIAGSGAWMLVAKK
ncbi:MAG: hypothetical protein JXA09_08815 [Anaerolineae bacterium]|nr:hypothetical protein [Anaerolineae bacterium]